jgi:hypothetical protein
MRASSKNLRWLCAQHAASIIGPGWRPSAKSPLKPE